MRNAEDRVLNRASRSRAVCETYRDNNKRDPHEFMNGRTVVSRLAGRCLLKLRAIDTGRISDNTKTTRPGGKRSAHGRNETRTNIFFVVTRTLYHGARHHRRSSSPTRRLRRARTYTADGARANLTHFRCTKSVPREHIFTFFSSHSRINRPAVTQTRHHPSRAFHFVLTVRTFAALSSPSSSFCVRLSIRLRLFHSPPTLPTLTVFSFSAVSICPTRSSQPPFTRSLTPSALDVPISFARKQCCGRPRAYTLFSLNKFNLNFPAVRNVY